MQCMPLFPKKTRTRGSVLNCMPSLAPKSWGRNPRQDRAGTHTQVAAFSCSLSPS